MVWNNLVTLSTCIIFATTSSIDFGSFCIWSHLLHQYDCHFKWKSIHRFGLSTIPIVLMVWTRQKKVVVPLPLSII
jgi:hypothetical protein